MEPYTIEDIELLRKKSGMTYQEAVALLDYHDGNLARALIDLEKNGRLKGLKALVATTMNVKPVLIGDDGEIKQIDQSIGINHAVNRMLYHVEKKDFDRSLKVRITQCDSKELCTKIARILNERFGFEDVKIINAGGLSTTYENPGGVVMAIG